MPRDVATFPSAYPDPRFRPLDGHVQLAVAEAVVDTNPRPHQVTAILAAMCAELNGTTVDADTARCISSAGREWLLQRIAMQFGENANWFVAPCSACGEQFDLQVSLNAVPRSEAGPGFPVAEVDTSLGLKQFEAPNGGHEEACGTRGASKDPMRVFAALCGLTETAEEDAIRYSAADLTRIDQALETISPEIADSVDIVCPVCEFEGRARIDPLTYAFPKVDDVLEEIHLLAAVYGWSEAEILDLPLTRRSAYARLIGTKNSRSTRQGGKV
jgi:hypothetical protein